MKNRYRDILVGATALLGLAGVATMLVMFGSLPTRLENGYDIHVRFTNASGLSGGSRVRLNGIDVGQVTLVEILYPPEQGVKVTAKIREDVPLPEGVLARVQGVLLGGSPALELDISQVKGKFKKLPTDGSLTLTGEAPTLLEGFAKSFQGPIHDAMAKLDRLNENFEVLAKQWTEVGKNINELTRQTSPSDVDSGKAQGNLASVMARADLRLKEMKTTLDGLNRWVNDEKLRADFQQTMANAREVTGRLDKSVDEITRTAQSTRESMDKLVRRFVAVADDLSATIASARQTIDLARTGNGTVGKLLQDPQLYNNLTDAVKRVDQSMVDFQLLLERLKAEGIPLKIN